MKTFVLIMMIIMGGTLIAWHSYENTDMIKYDKMRKVFFMIVSAEFFLMVLVWLLKVIFFS